MGSTGIPSNELRKLIEKKPKKKTTERDRESGSPQKNGLFELAQEFDDSNEMLGRRDSPEQSLEKGDWTEDLSRSGKRLKDTYSAGKTSPHAKYHLKQVPEQKTTRSGAMMIPETTYHLRFFSSKRVTSSFNNQQIPCIPSSLINN